jgi:hypothetical protein
MPRVLGHAATSNAAILLAVSAVLCLVPVRASAQSFPGSGHIGPTKAEIVGIGIGAAAVVGLVVYLAIPKHPTVEGCVETVEGTPRLTAADHKTYILAPGDVALVNGRQFKLKGKKHKDKAGNRQFAVKKLVKDKGACTAQAGS